MMPNDLGYSVQDVLDAWARTDGRFLGGLFAGGLLFYIYYVEAIRCGLRDRCAGMPWQTNMYNTAHDTIYLLYFQSWFTAGLPTHHVLSQIFWFGIAAWVCMEAVVHYQTLTWSRDELFPMISDRRFVVPAYIGCQAFLWLMVMWLRVTIDDPFFYILIATTYTACLLFNFHFLHRRGSRRGQSPAQVWALAFTPVCYWFFCLPGLSARMDNLWTYAFGLANCAVSFGYLAYFRSFPASQRQGAAQAQALA